MQNSCLAKSALLHKAPSATQPRGLTLRVNFVWTLFGNLVYAGCQWCMVVALAKLGNPAMVGEFALALAIASPVMICAGLSSLRIVQATDAAGEYRFGDYLSLRLLTTGVALLAIVAILSFSSYGAQTSAVIMIVGVAKGFENISDVFSGFLQQHERMDRIAISAMIKGFLSLAAVAGGILWSGNLSVAVSGLALGWALTLLFYDAPASAALLRSSPVPLVALRPCWNSTALRALALLGLPVVVAAALVSLNSNIPRYFIQHSLGMASLGIFAALIYPMMAGTTVINALGQAAMPRLAQHFSAGNHSAFCSLLARLLSVAIAVGACGLFAIWLAGRPILSLLYKPEYAEYVTVFFWLGIGTVIFFVSGLLGYGMNAVRHFRAQLLVAVAVAIVTAAACAILIPRHHLIGAALAVTFGMICQAVANAAVIAYALRSPSSRSFATAP